MLFRSGGPGAAATTNDATWNHRFYNIALWTTAGGVFNASASATQNIDQQGSYSWSSAGMITDVQSWLNSPGLNFGWLIKTDENNSFEAKEFGSRNNLNSLIRPTLQINYTIPAQCYATNVALGTPTATDNCGSVSTSNNGPSQYPVGNTIVIWTATDNGGNTATCNQTVTVIDNILPTITCPTNITVNPNPGTCIATGVSLGSVTTSDNCGIATTLNNAPTQYGGGVTTVTWTTTDVNGNTASCSQTVTLLDNTPPTITCPSNKTVNMNTGLCVATGVSLGVPVTNDNCGILSTTNNAPTQFTLGSTTVIWTTSDNSGNTASCSQTVTVIDNQLPTITCPANTTVNANTGQCFATAVSLGTPTTSDNCGIAGTTNNAPTQYNVGTTTVVWTTTDVNGNTASCSQTIGRAHV